MIIAFAKTSLRNHRFSKAVIPRKLYRLVLLILGLLLFGLFFKFNLFDNHGNWKIQNFKGPAKSFFSSLCPTSNSFCRNVRGSFQAEDPKCKIPELQPFDESIQRYLAMGVNNSGDDEWWCKDISLLFNSTLESEIVPVVDLKVFKEHDIVSCCYKVIHRKEDKEKPDAYFRYSDECHQLSLTKATKIPDEHEFIAIFCRDENNTAGVYDMHAFVSVSESEMPVNSEQEKLNILILGVDSVSRMNFIRSMPRTYDFLMQTLNAVEMKGFNRNELNTFRCLLPMLTAQTYEEVSKNCGYTEFYDTCPFIWRKFKGYRTLLAEDWSSVAIFHYLKNGFHVPPVDHYRRPLALAAEEEFNRKKEQWGHCEGPRFSIQNLLDYTKKFVHNMNKVRKPFFSFTWATALTHMELGAAKDADPFLLEALEWFHSEGHLRNTLLILMSDHGIGWGDIRNTVQGQLEARLPFIYFVFPEEFKRRFPVAFQNLVGNGERLTTTMDLHETLSDLSDLGQLKNDMILRREAGLKSLENEGRKLPTGISHFLPIPASRSCEDAGLDAFYCACKENIREVSVHLDDVKQGALHAVDVMNRILEESPKCAKLKLERVVLAQRTMVKDERNETETLRPAYLLNFETSPGSGIFEGLAVEHKELPQDDKFKMSGYISRTNLYRNFSACVNDVDLKYYCFCKDQNT